VHFASGNGGNKIYIVPSLRMVIAITSSAYNTNYGQRRSQDILWKILGMRHAKTAGTDEQYPTSEAHDTGVEPVLTGVRFVYPSSLSLLVHRPR
jgi:hypothetical protein